MTDVTIEKPRRTLSPEQIARMQAGRVRAAAERKTAPRAKQKPKPEMVAEARALAADDELDGLTAEDCCDACTEDCCVITGRRRVRFENRDANENVTYTEGWTTYCGHPNKGGIQAALATNPEIKRRFNRAKKLLRHLAADRKAE